MSTAQTDRAGSRSVRVAAIQATPVFLDREATVARACLLIAEAAALGARVIAFPEVWISGYPVWLDAAPGAALWDHPPAKRAFARLVASAISIPSAEVDRLGEATRRAGAYVVVGAHELGGSTLYAS
ncbi:MAG: hypothetical protein M3121_03100, partial [Chloroflexota bacterium]|nr:hypothetical protein [Chloroflexota bacterium]